jgi:hypothetical protein
MANINWELEFHIDPSTLQPTTSSVGTIAFPTYGNFGGPLYTNGQLTGSVPLPPPNSVALDPLDQLFKLHDNAILTDADLLQGIVELKPNQLDAEGDFYAGVTALALIGQLTLSGEFLSPKELSHDVRVALHDVQSGLQHLPPQDALALQNLLVEDAPYLQVLGAAVQNLAEAAHVQVPDHGHHGDFILL